MPFSISRVFKQKNGDMLFNVVNMCVHRKKNEHKII
jgi:hypothetical protein